MSLLRLLAFEDPAAIAPEMTSAELMTALRTLYPPEKESLGVLAFELASDTTPEIRCL